MDSSKTSNFGLNTRGPLGFELDSSNKASWDFDLNMQFIDSALGTAGFTPPPTKTLYVDRNRTDVYTADGSLLKPFKTIMGAVNQVAANGDNSSVNYVIQVAAGNYQEMVDLSSSALVYLTFVGYGVVLSNPTSAALLQAINNDNLLGFEFLGFVFDQTTTSLTHGITLTATTNGTTFGAGAFNAIAPIQFTDCYFETSGINFDLTVSNCGGVYFDRCQGNPVINVTNCIVVRWSGGNFNQGGQFNAVTNLGLPQPAGFSGSTQIQCRYVTCAASVSTDAGSTFIAYLGSRISGAVTVNGTFISRSSLISGAITVNSGGVYREDGGSGHTGTLALNGTGAYQQTGTYGIGTLKLNGITVSVGNGNPNGVIVGSQGDIFINVASSSPFISVLWIKESGMNTNIGWTGK